MDPDQLKRFLKELLGPDGLNLKTDGVDKRELSIVKVDPFHGREDEDLYEWMEAFEQAAMANKWTPLDV